MLKLFLQKKRFLVLVLFILANIKITGQNNKADFAIYNPGYEDDGVWEEEVLALKSLFFTYGWSFRTVDHDDMNNGELGSGENRNFNALIAPGGWALNREVAINQTGENNIRDFISSGGNFIGFCAGAYWAADTVSWAQNPGSEGSLFYEDTDYRKYNYNLNLFSGVSKGPFGWTPWSNGDTASFQVANVNLNNEIMSQINMPETTRFFYYGGPFFENISETIPDFEIWAEAVVTPENDQEEKIGDGKPTIIKYGFGAGTVILFSYHPEILINSRIDDVQLSEFFAEDQLNWDTGEQTLAEINLHSWNIVHAALQIANNESVTQISTLPVPVELRLFLEGSYNESNGRMNIGLNSKIPFISPYIEDSRYIESLPADIVDWLFVEFRKETRSETIFSKSLLLRNDGYLIKDSGIGNILHLNIPPDEYYVIIRHRNHIPIMSNHKIHLKPE